MCIQWTCVCIQYMCGLGEEEWLGEEDMYTVSMCQIGQLLSKFTPWHKRVYGLVWAGLLQTHLSKLTWAELFLNNYCQIYVWAPTFKEPLPTQSQTSFQDTMDPRQACFFVSFGSHFWSSKVFPQRSLPDLQTSPGFISHLNSSIIIRQVIFIAVPLSQVKY